MKNQLYLKELSKFLVKAKIQSYAGNGKEIETQRPYFKELEFSEGAWNYRDSYSGFYSAQGQEVVKYKGKPFWVMSYSGGMKQKYHGDFDFAKQTFGFLKKVLKLIEKSRPFRGPEDFKEADYNYVNEVKGDIKSFKGAEIIFYKDEEVFRQDYIGGLVIGEN